MSDLNEYYRFTTKARLDKAINSLMGIINGINIDTIINEKELNFLKMWIVQNDEYRNRHPYNEFVAVLESAIKDNIITNEEKEDIVWLCEKQLSTEYYDETTASIQCLQGVVSGIAADKLITVQELSGLQEWLDIHDELETCWPYDEINSG
jgi:hypothetical protein